jgi:hypothetical protein
MISGLGRGEAIKMTAWTQHIKKASYKRLPVFYLSHLLAHIQRSGRVNVRATSKSGRLRAITRRASRAARGGGFVFEEEEVLVTQAVVTVCMNTPT